MRRSLRNLGLVGAIAGLCAGCPDDGGGGEGGTGDGTDGATSAPGDDDGAVTVGDDDDGSLDETTGPLPPDMGLQPPSACEDACANRAACGASEVQCINQCDADFANYMETSGECLDDFESLLACIAGLGCEDLAVFDDPPPGEAYPCEAEDEAFTTSCLLGGEPPPPTCEAYCAVITECTRVAPNECDAICTMQLTFAEGLGTECVDATTAQIDCIGTLDCAGYEAFDAQDGDYPCMAEAAEVETACGM